MIDAQSNNDATAAFAKFLIVIPVVAVLLIPGCFVTGWIRAAGGGLPAPEGPPAMLIVGDPSATGKLAAFANRFTPHTPPRKFDYINRGWFSYSGEDIAKLSSQSHIHGESWTFYQRGESSGGPARQLNYVNAAVQAEQEKNDFVLALALAQLAHRGEPENQAQAYRDAADELLRKGSLTAPEKTQVLDVLADGYIADRYYGAAELCLRRLQPLIAECLGPASIAMAVNYNRMGESLGSQGRWAEAEEPLRKAAAIMEVRREGDLHLDALARCLSYQKKFGEQLGVYQFKIKKGSDISDSEQDERKGALRNYVGAPIPLKLPAIPYTDFLDTAEKVTALGDYSDARYYYWEAQRVGKGNEESLKNGWAKVCAAYGKAKQGHPRAGSQIGEGEQAQSAKVEELLKHAVASGKTDAANDARSAAKILVELPKPNNALMQQTAAILVKTAQRDIDHADVPETFTLTQLLLQGETDPNDVDADDLAKRGMYASAAYVLRTKARRAPAYEVAPLLHQLAHCFLATGEHDKAYNALSQALASTSDVKATLTDMVRCRLNAWRVFDAAYLQGAKSGYETFSNVVKQLDHVGQYSGGCSLNAK